MNKSYNSQLTSSISSLVARVARITGHNGRAQVGGGTSEGRITVHQLKELISKGEDIMLIDIRLPWEYHASHIPGSISIPYFEITEAIRQGLLQGKLLVLYCRVGIKSIRAKNVMRAMGVHNVADLVGGIFAWEEAGLDTITGDGDGQRNEGTVS